MDLSSVGTALDLLSKASKGLDSVRERAKVSSDADLKKSIAALYDDFLDLKSIILRLSEEIAGLKRTIADAGQPSKPQIKQVGQANYYYVGDEGPFCQPCYDTNSRLVNLTPRDEYVSGIGRRCLVCHHTFIEAPRPAPAPSPRRNYWE